MPVFDFPFPVPRGGPRKSGGLPVPHPASGSPPDLLDILAESGTYNLPHPDVVAPGDMGRVQDVVNNPSIEGVGAENLLDEAFQLAVGSGGSGQIPALRRALLEALSDAHISQLDTEAKVNPTMARLAMGPNQGYELDDIMGLSSPPPSLSGYFASSSPVDNPDVMTQQVNTLLSNLDRAMPQIDYGEKAAAMDIAAESIGPMDAEFGRAFDAAEGTQTDTLRALLQDIHHLSIISKMDPEESMPQLLQLLGNTTVPEDRIFQAVMQALALSGVGSGKRAAHVDPVSRRSLAPDLNFPAIRQSAESDNPEADIDLMMRMMGGF